MDFITGLLFAEKYNAICTIIDRLFKERHYVFCHWGNEGTAVDETVSILIWNVYRLYGLSDSIVSDRGSQFISTIWKSFNARLDIKINLSTVFHPETDGQTERANQDVEQGLRIYVNYIQNDWPRWLPIIEFADNNNRFASSSLTPFFLNKGFHPRMSFCPDQTSYETTKQRLDAAKAEDIAMQMEGLLEFAKRRLLISQQSIKNQTDRRRKDVTYSLGNWV